MNKSTSLKNEKILILLIDILLGIILPAILVLILLGRLIFGSGYIFFGDEQATIFYYQKNSIDLMIYSWFSGSPTSSVTVVFSLISTSLIEIFGTYYANHLLTFLIPYLSGPFFYFSTINLMKYFKIKRVFIIRISATIGAIFYLINWQNPNLITPLYTWGMSYMITPILVYFLVKIFDSHKKTDILKFALISTVGDSVPMWIITVGLFIIIIMILTIIDTRKVRSLLLLTKDTLYLLLFTILANAYFLFETLGGFLNGVGGQYTAYGSISSSISTAHTSSFLNLYDVFMFGQPAYSFFGQNPKNFTILNISIPLVVIFFVSWFIAGHIKIKIKKDKYSNRKYIIEYSRHSNSMIFKNMNNFNSKLLKKFMLTIGILLIISLVLSKGYNSPFGSFYTLAITLSPPGLLGITRDVTPFLMISALCYAYIFLISSFFILEAINEYKKEQKKNLLDFINVNKIFTICLAILLCASFLATVNETEKTLTLTNERFAPKFVSTE